MKHPVVVLSGGLSHERDVSLRSGRRVAEALRRQGHEVVESDISPTLTTYANSAEEWVIFPTLHGGLGEDGAIRSVMDVLGLAYVGADGAHSRSAFDKSVASLKAAEAGLRTPRQISLPHDVFRELGAQTLVSAIGDSFGFPVMVKPACSGSALGATKVSSVADLPPALVGAFAYGQVNVIESFISGTEVAVTVVDLDGELTALPAVEIQPVSGVYDYAARYTAGETRFVTPADVDASVAEACADMAKRAHQVFGLRDLSRTDIIIDEAGEPVFIEVNVAPGMTETSLVPLALDAAEMDLGVVASALVEQAAARRYQR